jgi:hypothetical protein
MLSIVYHKKVITKILSCFFVSFVVKKEFLEVALRARTRRLIRQMAVQAGEDALLYILYPALKSRIVVAGFSIDKTLFPT